MQKLRAGAANVRRSLSFERRRSSSFERGRSSERTRCEDPATDAPLGDELCLELVADLHGDDGVSSTRRLLAACSGESPVVQQNRTAVARAGLAPALVGLLHDGGPGTARGDHREDALELLALLTAEPGEGVVHCQLVFVGVVEALLPLLAPSRRGLRQREARTPWKASRVGALAYRLLLHVACTNDGLEGVLRDGAGSMLAALLAAGEDEGVAAAAHYRRTASFILQFHQHLSSERLIEFATDPDYVAMLQAAQAVPSAASIRAAADGQAAEKNEASTVQVEPAAEAVLSEATGTSSDGGAGVGAGAGTGPRTAQGISSGPTRVSSEAAPMASDTSDTDSHAGATSESGADAERRSPADIAEARPFGLPAYWEIGVSRSTGRRYFINAITGESQYEIPDDRDELVTKHYAAQIIQTRWRAVAHRGFDGTGIVDEHSDRGERELGTLVGAEQEGITWEEVDLTFETQGPLGLVFSSETETATKVVTEVVPGKLASQVPELSSVFDSSGRPIPGQVRRTMSDARQLRAIQLIST